MRNFFITFFTICSCLLIFSGCHSKVMGHEILGRWEHNGSIIEFRNDGYFIKGDEKYEFAVTNDKVTIDENGNATILDYAMNSNGTLTMNGLIYYPVPK